MSDARNNPVIRKWRKAESEAYKRSDHNDFATSKELRDRNFSGFRANSITEEIEIWLFGQIERRVSKEELKRNPTAVEEAMAAVFHLDDLTVVKLPKEA